MIDRLFVVIGAGASHGCAPSTAPRDDRYTPPLVTGLFNPSPDEHRVTAKALSDYPVAKLAAADLRDHDDSLAIEEVIRTRYRDSNNDLDQRIFRAIPPYLQELLHQVSYGYTRFPQNYESLVTNLLRLKEVVFVSLNYDVILDRVLELADDPVLGMEWYIKPKRHWSLIKLHGSVSWGRPLPYERDIFTAPRADLDLSTRPVVRQYPNLERVRGLVRDEPYDDGYLYYPVISVPVGRSDELVCPPDHVEFLRERLSASQPLHLLLIGYSGVDREVLALLKQSGRGIKTLTIVDKSLSAARQVADHLRRVHDVQADETHPHAGDFTHWVESGSLSRFVTSMSERPL